MKYTYILLCILLLVTIISGFILGCGGKRPNNIGIREGQQLAPCPNSPNCVSSQSHISKHRVEPFVYSSSKEESFKKLKEILQNNNRITIISESENYIYAECKTAFFKFIDDLEFYFDDENKLIHIRSASRIGYSDLGVNRRRVEDIRKKFIAWQKEIKK